MKVFHKKGKGSIVMMVVLAMMLQIVGPVVGTVYAAMDDGAFRVVDERPDFENEKVYIDWEFDLDLDKRVVEFNHNGKFTLEKEVEGKLSVNDEDKTVIGTYKISAEGKVTVNIDPGLYKEDDVTTVAPTDPADEEETGEPTKPPEPEGNEGNLHGTEGKNDDDQEASMLGKVTNLVYAGDDLPLVDFDIGENKVKTFKGTIEVEGARERVSLFGKLIGLFSTEEDLGLDIFKSVKLLINGNEVGDGDDGIVNLDKITESMTIGLEFGWKLPDNVEGGFQLEKGYSASIKIPEVFKGVTGYMEGPLKDGSEVVGTYEITDNGMLTVVFGKVVGFEEDFLTKTDREGTVGFILDFVMEPFNDNSIQEIEFGAPINKTFTIKVKPSVELDSISKSGGPNKVTNADAIDWVIDVNTSLESLTNAIVKDSIPEGLKLEGDIEIYHLKVGIDGSLSEGALKEKISSIDVKKLEVTLGGIDTAYRIKYSTKITDYSKSGYTNTAELFDGKEKKADSTVTVDKVEQGAAISKRSLTPDGNATTIKWEIDVNKGEDILKNVIVEDVLQKNLTVKADFIKIFKLNKGEGSWVEGADVTSSFIPAITNFPLSLGDLGTTDVYRIKFETDIEYMEYQETNTFQNKAILEADKEVGGVTVPVVEESTASATVYRDPIIIKEGKEITSHDSDFPVVEWTIKINGANHHIYGAVLTDTIGSGLELIEDSIEIYDSEGSKITIETGDNKYPRILSNVDNVMKIGFGDIDSSYIIKYQTEITSIDKDTFKNKAELTGTGKHGVGVGEGGEPVEYDVKKDVIVPPSIVNNSYSKEAVSIDYSKKTMTWQIEIDAVKEALTELTITDTFDGKYMVFIEEGFSVTKGGTELTPASTYYTLTNNNVNGFVLEFKEAALGKGKYAITYKTSFDPNEILKHVGGTPKTDGDNIYKNKVKLTGKLKESVGVGTKNLDVDLEDAHTLNKDIFNVGKKEGKLDREKKEITWRIYVNAQSRDLTGSDLKVTDTIGEGHTFKAGSLSVQEFTLKPGGNLSVDDNENGITLGDYVGSSEYTLTPTPNSFILTFPDGIDKAYLIEYTTEIKGITQPNYENKAVITDNTGKPKTYQASVFYKDHNVFITKEALNANGGRVFADDELNWKVVVNESLSEIGDAVFADTMSAGHVYVDGSLKVYKGAIDENNLLVVDTTANADENKYTLNVSLNGDKTTSIKVGLGDIKGRYIVTYNTAVISDSGVITNTATLKGTDFNDKSTGIKKFNIITTSWGTGSGTSPLRGAIKIKKVDNASDPKPVVGAEFKLFYKVNAADTNWREVKDEIFKTGADGTLTIGNLPKGRTYKLVEEKAPTGYRMKEEDDDYTREIKVVADTITEATLGAIVNEKIRDITVKKVWIGPKKDGAKAKADKMKVKFTLKANGSELSGISPVTLNGNELTPWTHIFGDLDYYDSDGKEITYTAEEEIIYPNEESKTPGYQLLIGDPIKSTIDGYGNFTYTFNNKNMEKVNVEVEKIWWKDEGKLLPSQVTIELYKDGIKTDENLSLTTTGWKDKFTNLEKYDNEGREYVYTIKEVAVVGFKTVIGSKQTITGGFKYEVTNIETMDIEVEKKWIGIPPQGTKVTIDLHEKSADGKLKEPYKQRIIITKDTTSNKWEGKFKNIPKYDTAGNPIAYGIKEIKVNGFKQHKIEESKPENSEFVNKFTVTNMELVNVKVTKRWIGPAKSNVTLKLLADGSETGETKNLATANNEVYTFADLPKYKLNEKGEPIIESGNLKEIEYTVMEEGLAPNHEATIVEGTSIDSTIIYTITNRNIEKVKISVEKVWRTTSPNEREATIILKEEGTEINRIKLTGNATHTFEEDADSNLLFKYHQETGSLINYSVDEELITGFKKEIGNRENTSEGYSFTVTNIELMKIPVTKEWIGTPKVDEVTVTLHKNNINTPVVDTLTIKQNDGWKGEFTNISKYEASGDLTHIAYVIKEIEVLGFKQHKVEGDLTTGFTVTNMEIMKVEVTKKWIGPAKTGVILKLLADGVPVAGKTANLVITNDEVYTFDKLPKYKVNEQGEPIIESGNLKEIEYTVMEEGLAPNHEATIVEGTSTDSTIIYTITNRNIEKVKIPVKKVWRTTSPDEREATIILKEEGIEINRIKLTGNATHTFEEDADSNPLFKYHQETGSLINYSVDEELITGFKKEIGNRENTSEGYSFTITNIELMDIEVKKVWLGDYEATYKVEVILYENGSPTSTKTELNESNSWMAEFKDIPKYKANSVTPITYTIEETPITGYKTTITGDVENGFTVTNKKLINITGTKVWENGPTTKPTIQLQLYKNGVEEVLPVELTSGTVSHTWNNLHQTDDEGNPYTYKVDEVAVPKNYIKSISDDGLTVTNTYSSTKMDIIGTKVWVNPPTEVPTIWFKLYRQVGAGAIVEVSEIKELSKGTTTVTWKDMDITDSYGNEYTYSVKEVDEGGNPFVPEHYTKVESGLKVTNTYIYEIPKISITGTKAWVGGPTTKPAIQLQLYKNGVAHEAPVTLDGTESTPWMHTWMNLDKTDRNRVGYEYTVDEVTVPDNYSRSRSVDKLTITNTYGSPKEDITGTKVWVNGSANRPDSIELQLYRRIEGGTDQPVGGTVVLEKGTYVYDWKNQDKTDGNGKPYIYTVKEVGVPVNYNKEEKWFNSYQHL